ncbi:tRNA (cytidine(34)-2'-O)-methyltransferase (EC [Olavius algarvensis Delta 1 endosymbiont]|nr:tRNA (cytidine(34)-2'-O)-methyltransferase (EC [Olavius algarvensis Delta 1 endosymbiont]
MSKNHTDTDNSPFERHVVLVEPEIHWNTGNISRTCLATGAALHLIRPLGFSLASREVKRAGLDYWEKVKLAVWDNFEDFAANMTPQEDEVAVFSKKGAKSFWTMKDPQRLFLIFGSETRGLPDPILGKFPNATYHIPINSEIRSLNLSTAAGIALYESLRTAQPFHAWLEKG